MEIDIMNQLLTSTVMIIFGGKNSILIERKKGSSSVVSATTSAATGGSDKQKQSEAQWIVKEAPQRLIKSLQLLGLSGDLTSKSLQGMNFLELTQEKKKVKNELKKYDNQFNDLYGRVPERRQKQPFRPLYLYYKRLKVCLSTRFSSQQATAIELEIKNLEQRRANLRKLIEDYQKQFERNNNRRILYVRDIAPIQKEYAEYKETKIRIAEQQQKLKRINPT